MLSFRRIRIRLADDEAGFTIIELMAALSVLAIGFFSLAGALGIGFRQIAIGRQRQTATEIGNARVEHLRNVPYSQVALSSAPVHDSDPSKPDWFVSSDGSQFDYSGNGDLEDLVVDEVNGQVLHLEDPVDVGETTMEIWQYVTWYDQPNNIKRLTAVVVFKPAALSGVSRMVRVSSFFTPGTVTVSGEAASATHGFGTPTPTAAPSASVCLGDTTAPTGDFSILSATGSTTYTSSTTVSLGLSFSDACTPIEVGFSNDDVVYGLWIQYDANNPAVGWTLPSGDGTKDVWGKVRDGALNTTSLGPLSIVLDTIAPTPPGTLTRSVSCSGTSRTVSLTWGSSTDTNFLGYRVYISTNSSSWQMLTTTSVSNTNDTHSKTLDSVRYYVVGYDKAGNESDATNTVALSKNQCS